MPLLFSEQRKIDVSAETFSLLTEFRIQQPANTSVLIKIAGEEAELEVSVTEPGEEQSASTEHPKLKLTYLRVAPVYQVIDALAEERNLDILINPLNVTNRSSVSLEVFELVNSSPSDMQRNQAFQLYSQAIETTDNESPEFWAPRVEGLRQAVEIFEDLGMRPEILHAKALLADFTYYPLYQYRQAIEIAREVEREAKDQDDWATAVMAMQIRAQSLIERDDDDTPEQATAKLAEAQTLLDQIQVSADDHDLKFQKAWAINLKGIGYFYQDAISDALAEYQRALPLAVEVEDDYLETLARENIALAHERLGQEAEALAMLDSIYALRAETGDESGRVRTLSEQGRIYMNLHQFPQAVRVLSEVVRFSEETGSVETSGRSKINLAHAYYEMGNFARAEALIDDAMPDLQAANFGRGLREANQLLANINRYRGNLSATAKYRTEQERYIQSDQHRAFFFYEKALDVLAAPEPYSEPEFRLDSGAEYESAIHFLSKSLTYTAGSSSENAPESSSGNSRGNASGYAVMQSVLRLELCNLQLRMQNSPEACNLNELRSDYEALRNDLLPKWTLRGMELWSDILAFNGDTDEAMSVLNDIVEQMAFYRRSLPGVLGAWYWERRKSVFERYLRLAIEADLQSGNGMASLLLFDRLRNFELNNPQSPTQTADEEPVDSQALQISSLMARLEKASDDSDRASLERELSVAMLERRQQVSSSSFVPTTDWLSSVVSALPENAVLVAYHFFPDQAYIWMARNSGVTLQALETRNAQLADFNALRQSLVVQGGPPVETLLASIGQVLLEPLTLQSGETIYLLPSGPLNGFPFEALMVNGTHLAQQNQVSNLLTIQSIESIHSPAQLPATVFVAGNPLGAKSGRGSLATALEELEFVAASFPKANITLVEGQKLERERFQSAEFRQAELVHIASHGSINLEYPSLSTLMLGAESDSQDASFLTPLEIANQSLNARLVVLSACETTGVNAFDFDANLGFVSTFLMAGSEAVVASLWPVSDSSTTKFMQYFYGQLRKGQRAEVALADAKRAALADRDALRDWAAFQIYIR